MRRRAQEMRIPLHKIAHEFRCSMRTVRAIVGPVGPNPRSANHRRISDAAIITGLAQGMTYAAIGKAYGLSRQAVWERARELR